MQLVETSLVGDDVALGSRHDSSSMAEAIGGRDALMLVDSGGRVVHVNDEWILLSGREAAEFVGKPACDGPAARDCEALDLLRHALSDGVARSAVVFMRHRRGFQLKLQVQVATVSSAEDGASGFIIRMRPANG